MKTSVLTTTLACLMAAASVGCSGNATSEPTASLGQADNGNHFGELPFQLTSPNFADGDRLPAQYTCEAKPFAGGVSPELDWTKGPKGTKSYAIVLRDVSIADPNFAFHWAIWNIPHDRHTLPEGLPGVPADPIPFPDGMKGAQQVQARGVGRYFPPCPAWPVALAEKCGTEPVPERNTDSYTFTIYAFAEDEIDVPPHDPTVNPNYVDRLNTLFDSMDLGHVSIGFTSDAVPDPQGFPPAPVFQCP